MVIEIQETILHITFVQQHHKGTYSLELLRGTWLFCTMLGCNLPCCLPGRTTVNKAHKCDAAWDIYMELLRSDGMWQQLDIFLISKCETRDGTNAFCDDTLFPAASHLWALFVVVLAGKQQGRLYPNMVQKSHVPRKNSNEYIPLVELNLKSGVIFGPEGWPVKIRRSHTCNSEMSRSS